MTNPVSLVRVTTTEPSCEPPIVVGHHGIRPRASALMAP